MSETLEAEVIESSAVVEHQAPAPIVRADARNVVAAFHDYQQIQTALDKAMPDCLMQIQGRMFRKKAYWRGIATAFNLDVEPTSERREDNGDDWGYCITYKATAGNGRSAYGDGACFASEKWSDRPICPQCGQSEFAFRSKQTGGESHFCWRNKGGCGAEWTPDPTAEVAIDKSSATVHNVRSHAHTRAFNRAVSNLVGFGEVSAEELNYDAPIESPPDVTPPTQPIPPPRQPSAAPAVPPPDGSVEPWMHDVVGFGKHKERTWFELANGSENGEAHSYLKWGVRNFENAERLSKAQACIEMLEARVAGQKAAERAEADALPPVGEGVESVF